MRMIVIVICLLYTTVVWAQPRSEPAKVWPATYAAYLDSLPREYRGLPLKPGPTNQAAFFDDLIENTIIGGEKGITKTPGFHTFVFNGGATLRVETTKLEGYQIFRRPSDDRNSGFYYLFRVFYKTGSVKECVIKRAIGDLSCDPWDKRKFYENDVKKIKRAPTFTTSDFLYRDVFGAEKGITQSKKDAYIFTLPGFTINVTPRLFAGYGYFSVATVGLGTEGVVTFAEVGDVPMSCQVNWHYKVTTCLRPE